MSGDSISIGSVVNNGGLNNTGKIEIAGDQVLNAGGAPAVTAAAVFKAIAEAVPVEDREQIEQQVIEPLNDELATLAAAPPEQQEQAKQSVVERITAIVSPLQPYAAEISKALLTFTEVGLTALPAPGNWFVSATLAAIKALKG